jgi:hypothetical protein
MESQLPYLHRRESTCLHHQVGSKKRYRKFRRRWENSDIKLKRNKNSEMRAPKNLYSAFSLREGLKGEGGWW